MKLSDLQLGDVVEAVSTTGAYPGKGVATVVALDSRETTYSVLLAWNGSEASFRGGDARHDNLHILTLIGVKYLPNIYNNFSSSLWVEPDVVVRKVSASAPAAKSEHPCKQCRKMNDRGVGSCWWCGASNPTS